jgi:hypothetical protein
LNTTLGVEEDALNAPLSTKSPPMLSTVPAFDWTIWPDWVPELSVTLPATVRVPPLKVSVGRGVVADPLMVSERMLTVPLPSVGWFVVDPMVTLSVDVGAPPPVQPVQFVPVAHVVFVVPVQTQFPGAETTTFAGGDTGVVSLLVATEKLVFVYVAAAGLVIPAIVTTLAPPADAAHDAPAREIVTVVPVVDPVAEQFVNPLVNVIVGVAGMLTNAGSNTAVMVSPAASAPVLVVVNPTAQLATNPETWGVPVNVTPVTAPAAITTAPAGDPVAASDDVFTENEPGPYEPCAGFVIPEIVT